MYTVLLTPEFEAWLEDLSDVRDRMRILARLRHITAGTLGDWRSLGGELGEFRVHSGPGYRMYFVRRDRTVIIVLAGGTKGTQSRDIARARHALTQLDIEP